MRRLLPALLLLAAHAAWGQPSSPTPPSSPSALTAPGDSTGAHGLTPRGALWRSALLPGWGQMANGHPFKAVLFAGAAGGWLTAAILEHDRIDAAATPDERRDRAARRNTRVLYYFLAATLAGLDAYVDEHLDDFDLDPGLDETTPGIRVAYRF